MDRIFGGGTAGYLGIVHNPFELFADPNVEKFSARDITPPAGIDANRLTRRRAMLGRIDALQRRADLQPAAFASLDQHYQAALNLITAPETKHAFEIGSEDPTLRDRYGRNRFGQRCLLARRLIEAGVPLRDRHRPRLGHARRQLQVAQEQPDAARRSGVDRAARRPGGARPAGQHAGRLG